MHHNQNTSTCKTVTWRWLLSQMYLPSPELLQIRHSHQGNCPTSNPTNFSDDSCFSMEAHFGVNSVTCHLSFLHTLTATTNEKFTQEITCVKKHSFRVSHVQGSYLWPHSTGKVTPVRIKCSCTFSPYQNGLRQDAKSNLHTLTQWQCFYGVQWGIRQPQTNMALMK